MVVIIRFGLTQNPESAESLGFKFVEVNSIGHGGNIASGLESVKFLDEVVDDVLGHLILIRPKSVERT